MKGNTVPQPRPDQPKLCAGCEKGNTVIIISFIVIALAVFVLVGGMYYFGIGL